ncbi:MAG: glycyl-radical enzyme activating protein [Lentisphaeria bacterium]|nr:glycyl-radical enzyme activating protein [Lentisphaeria bacterium]
MSDEKTLIFDIEKFAVHDGPGIRTVVFLKGCPLHCRWCHNPESQSFEPELLFYSGKCTRCGICAAACPRSCHTVSGTGHVFERGKCAGCGSCAESCPADALKLCGRKMSVSEVMTEVLKDQVFYRNSGGGITLSGGEPLAHFAFTSALLKAAKEAEIHTAVETSGFAPWERIRELLPLVDLWLWDVKAAPEKHEKLTGVQWEPIHANLEKLARSGATVMLRCPLVPGINDEDAQLIRIAELANQLGCVQRIDLEPYHPLGEGKNLALGRNDSFHSAFASAADKKRWQETIAAHTAVLVHI